MKKIICLFLLIVLLGCTSCNNFSNEMENLQNNEPFVIALPMKDYPTADTVNSMSEQSTYVVVGEFIEFDSKWNMMRDVDNPELESKDHYAEGHLYRFKVDNVLKGVLEDDEILINQEYSEIVTYTESDRVIENGVIQKEATWSKDYQIEVINERYFEPKIGVKYMLFLDKGTYFYGACEPFAIDVSNETPHICSGNIKTEAMEVNSFETFVVDGREILAFSNKAYSEDFVSEMSTQDVFDIVEKSVLETPNDIIR